MLNNAPRRISRTALALTLLAALFGTIAPALFAQSDPLASWNDGAVKKNILDFVRRTTTSGSQDLVSVAQRIARLIESEVVQL